MYTISREAFVHQLDLIRMRTAPGRVPVSRLLQPEGPVPVILTFDDGAMCASICVANELETRGCIGHFFVTTDWIGHPGFLDERRIRELSDRGHVIGSHSRTHPERMSSLSYDELLCEWYESCRVLSNIVRGPVRIGSVAGGYYSRKVARAAAAAGITVLFTSEPTTAVKWVDGCAVLGRYSIHRSTPATVVAAIVSGAKWPRHRQAAIWFAKKGVKCIAGRWFPDLRRALLAAGFPS